MSTGPAAARLAPDEPLSRKAAHEPPSLVAVAEFDAPLAAPFVPLSIAPWAPISVSSREAIKRRLLVTADSIALGLVLVAILSRLGLWAGGVAAALTVPAVLVVFHTTGLYSRDELRLGHTTLDEAPLLLALTGLLALGTAILAPGIGRTGLGGSHVAALWAASFMAILCARTVARAFARRILPIERCLVIGETARAERIRDKIDSSAARAEVVGCLPMTGRHIGDLTDAESLRAVAEKVGAHRLIIAGSPADADNAELLRAAKVVGVHLTVLPPQMFDVIGSAASFHDLEGMTMLGVVRFGLPRSSRLLKRALDLIAAVIGVVLIGPVLAGVALAIRIDSKGPIFFRQTRIGRDGRPFSIVKFRSMVADADRRKEALRAVKGSDHGGLFKLHDDPRVTRVGKFLRKSSLDELPQIFNVLRGEMSLVGPRPLVVDEDCQIIGLHRGRLHLTPGMTGPWQLLRSRVPLEEMVEIDYLYVANWSLWHDLKILLRTVGHVARRGNV